MQHTPHTAVSLIYRAVFVRGVSLPVSLSHGFVPCKASWMPRTPWPSALTNSSATCKRFVRSTETSASTARRHGESLPLWTNWLLSGLPVFVDGWVKPLLVVSHSHSENSTGACGPSMLGDSCSADADVDAHQCRESCNFTVILFYTFKWLLTGVCWLVCFPGMFPYMMNDRFFLIPRHSEERCAGCKMPKARHPHTECDPALVR